MMLTQLATVARRTGYPVVEVPGWKTRGRPGGMNGVRTITTHHTANGGAKGNYPSLRVVRDGRKGLPGPLAQYGIGVDGTIYVIAAGKCNHAGASRRIDYTNPWAIGIEAEAEGVPGDKEDWPPKQMDSFARLCRALVDEFDGVGVADVRAHRETCSPSGRKSDPVFSMARFRDRVAAVNLSKASTVLHPPKPQPAKDDDVTTAAELWDDRIPLTATDAQVFNLTLAEGRPPFKAGGTVALSDMVRYPTLARKIDHKLTAFIEAQEKRDRERDKVLASILAALSHEGTPPPSA